MKKILFASLLISSAVYAEVIAYGPGGPAPVLKELATEFEAKQGKKVKIVAGPTGQWINQAKADADIIFDCGTDADPGTCTDMHSSC